MEQLWDRHSACADPPRRWVRSHHTSVSVCRILTNLFSLPPLWPFGRCRDVISDVRTPKDSHGFMKSGEDMQEEKERTPLLCNALSLPPWKTDTVQGLGRKKVPFAGKRPVLELFPCCPTMVFCSGSVLESPALNASYSVGLKCYQTAPSCVMLLAWSILSSHCAGDTGTRKPTKKNVF